MRALDVPAENFDLIRGEKANMVRVRLYEIHGPIGAADLPTPGDDQPVEGIVSYSTYDLWEFDQDNLFDYVAAHFSWYLEKAKSDYEKSLATEVREDRNSRLILADIAVNKALDNGDSEAEAKARQYRQALRDVPDQAGFPYNVIWPVLAG